MPQHYNQGIPLLRSSPSGLRDSVDRNALMNMFGPYLSEISNRLNQGQTSRGIVQSDRMRAGIDTPMPIGRGVTEAPAQLGRGVSMMMPHREDSLMAAMGGEIPFRDVNIPSRRPMFVGTEEQTAADARILSDLFPVGGLASTLRKVPQKLLSKRAGIDKSEKVYPVESELLGESGGFEMRNAVKVDTPLVDAAKNQKDLKDVRTRLNRELEKVDYLGFDTVGEARDAIRSYDDWSLRWDVSDQPHIIDLAEKYKDIVEKQKRIEYAGLAEQVFTKRTFYEMYKEYFNELIKDTHRAGARAAPPIRRGLTGKVLEN